MEQPSYLVLSLSGALDVSRYPEFRTAFELADKDTRPVLVDLSHASDVDSTFLSELLLFRRRTERTGRRVAVLISVEHPDVGRLFALADIADRILLFTDREQAVEALTDSEHWKGSTERA